MASATLQQIKDKVRLITRSLSTNILSDEKLEDYINTFILYDMPQHLDLFSLQSVFEFYAIPYQDVYETNTSVTTNPLYDFKNKYSSLEPPVYIGGYKASFSESREEYFNMYPKTPNIYTVGTGNGTLAAYNGTISALQGNSADTPTVILKNSVVFRSVDLNSNSLVMTDYPLTNNPEIGNLRVPNEDPTSTSTKDANNFINYITGEYKVTFNTAPKNGKTIEVATQIETPSLPYSLLYYENKITLRPVPDQPYKIQINAVRQPTEFLNSLGGNSQTPDLKGWWQYIAYGAAKKVFEDRMDLDSVQLILPEFKTQEKLVNRRTVKQLSSQSSPTIYNGTTVGGGPYGPGWFNRF